MYRVYVEKEFSSAHRLDGFIGGCERIHGHNWVIRCVIAGPRLDERGILIDFHLVSKILDELVGQYDHSMLNELGLFKNINPTAENIAKVSFDHINTKINEAEKTDDIYLEEIIIYETSTSFASYRP